MEKQRIFSQFKFISRLLISATLVCTAFFPASTQTLTNKEIKSLKFSSLPDVYTGKETQFLCIIPYAQPSDVQVEIPQLPSGVTFISMRKTAPSSDTGDIDLTGTQIELWFSFTDAKTYQLPALNVRIKNRLYRIPFREFVVTQNPATIKPVLIVSFTNGKELTNSSTASAPVFSVQEGEPVVFTLYLQYAVQILQFTWNIPEDSLFTELARFEITEGKTRGTIFSTERIPVARFEWKPLSSGIVRFPDITITATAYNGARTELHTPQVPVAVVKGHAETQPAADQYFAYAFAPTEEKNTENIKSPLSSDSCRILAKLRCAERHSLPLSEVYKKRISFETLHGITGNAAESSIPLMHLLLAAFLILIVAGTITSILNIKSAPFFLLPATCLCAVFIIISHVRLSRTYAICCTNKAFSVPEESSNTGTPVEPGTRVLLTEQTGNWIYIQSGNTGGWITKDKLIIIR